MDTKLNYYLQIADNALILSHRLSEYCSRAPFLEEDLANTNVALDLIGLAEAIYEEVARQENLGKTGDNIAYLRKEHEYYNTNLAEQPNEDFAHIMVRQFFIDTFHYYFFKELSTSKDDFLRAIALKSTKEVTYHLRRSSEWLIRLGKGSVEGREKTQVAIDRLWKFTNELFTENETDIQMLKNGIGVDLQTAYKKWKEKVDEIFYLGHYKLPANTPYLIAGKNGFHTEYLGYILCEMQFLPNKYPDAVW